MSVFPPVHLPFVVLQENSVKSPFLPSDLLGPLIEFIYLLIYFTGAATGRLFFLLPLTRLPHCEKMPPPGPPNPQHSPAGEPTRVLRRGRRGPDRGGTSVPPPPPHLCLLALKPKVVKFSKKCQVHPIMDNIDRRKIGRQNFKSKREHEERWRGEKAFNLSKGVTN